MARSMSDTFPNLGLVLRPPRVLNELPLQYRWEFTRRHPYYLQFWQPALAYRTGKLAEPQEREFGKLANQILLGLGFTGNPLDPGSTADDVGFRQLGRVWKEGAVAPATFRAMASMMIMDLPSHTQLKIARLLEEAAGHGKNDGAGKYDTVNKLHDADDEGLDAMPPRPFVGININMPAKAITSAIGDLVRDWKRECGITESRRRYDTLDDCLRTWDLREGWTGEGYDVQRELTFNRMATELSVPKETLVSRYRTAFRFLFGHEYTFAIWYRIFVVVKLAGPFGQVALRRRKILSEKRAGGSVKVVPDTVLSGNSKSEEGSSLSADLAAPFIDAQDWVDLRMDVEERVKQGLSDDQIVAELESEYPNLIPDFVEYLRNRMT